MSKSSWKIGAWAAEAERAEAEEEEEAKALAAAPPPPGNFPSLKEAAANTGKQKKGKKMSMSLQEFTLRPTAHSGSATSRGLTIEEKMRLPTAPRERSGDEMQHGRLGGGFSNYGPRAGSVGSNQGRSREYEGRRSYGVEEDERRGGPPHARVSEMSLHSRADESDNWSTMKKQTVPEYDRGQDRPGRKYTTLGGGDGPGGNSRGDEVDNWASAKNPIPQQPTKHSSFSSASSRSGTERWTRGERAPTLDSLKNDSGGEVTVKVNKPNPFGAARPREDVLAEKGLDWKKLDPEIEAKKEQPLVAGLIRPASFQPNRPESSHSSVSDVTSEAVVKQKPKVNPFGDAKPREVLLEEKGLDWKKIDLKMDHHRVVRPETEEEKNLKQEIDQLREELLQISGDKNSKLHDLVLQKERDLEALVLQLDDKVRYTQKTFERPRSGAGRDGEFSDRPRSRPGSYDEPRTDRPRSRPGAYDEPRTDRPRSRPGAYDEPRADRPRSRPGVYDEPRAGYPERPRSRPGRYEGLRAGSGERPPSWGSGYEDRRGGFAERTSSQPGAYGNPRPGSRDATHSSHSRGVNSWSRPSDQQRVVESGGERGFLGNMDVDRSGSRW